MDTKQEGSSHPARLRSLPQQLTLLEVILPHLTNKSSKKVEEGKKGGAPKKGTL